MATDKSFLILGGGGMIGFQIALHICRELHPEKIIIASLRQDEVRDAILSIKKILGQHASGITFIPFSGDIFVRAELTNEDRARLIENQQRREWLFDDLFGDLESSLQTSQLALLILEHKPDVIVDAMNTATAISYQDVIAISHKIKGAIRNIYSIVPKQADKLKKELKKINNSLGKKNKTINIKSVSKLLTEFQEFLDIFKTREEKGRQSSLQEMIESLIISQSIPQLVRHVLIVYEAMKRVKTRLYIKVGTTGTGGMGLNIPYTHSEAKPSAQLMTKTAVAFAHTGLLFLMARTPDAPLVKEVKPAAMVGYRKITIQTVKNKNGSPRFVYSAREERLRNSLILQTQDQKYTKKGKMKLAGVDTGENGFFAIGEFEAITNLKQMEFITPEEIAETVVLEIVGRNTGLDVVSGLDASVMNPSYRAGYLRSPALQRARQLEKRIDGHSVALRDLGPPELSKLLYEAHLLKLEYQYLDDVLKHSSDEISRSIEKQLKNNLDLRDQITSIGIPILQRDGKSIWRGPVIAYPEISGKSSVSLSTDSINKFAGKGWVDLRPQNFEIWSNRIKNIVRERHRVLDQVDEGSAVFKKNLYLWDEIRIGELVGWIFNNELGGYRILGL